MAGFEVVVRPAVLPNIRPTPSRSLPPEDNPDQGKATLSGSSGRLIALNYTFTANGNSPSGTETERTYDVARIRPEGDPNGDTYIDVEVARRIKLRSPGGEVFEHQYSPIQPADNIQIIQSNVTRGNQ